MSIPADQRARRHLGGLVTTRAAAEDTNGSLAVVEERAARGYTTPPHVHRREDETLFVIDGTLEYTVDGVTATAGAGEAAFLPRGRPHTFAVVSAQAHFLVIITPGGFERFFGEVSPPASADERSVTDPARMVESAAALGTTVFHGNDSALAAAATVATSTAPGEIAAAYRVIEDAVAGPGPVAPEPLATLLADVSLTRLAEHPAHARSLTLLGILVERTGADVGDRVSELVKAVRADWPEATALAAAYFFAHFPAAFGEIDAALSTTVLTEPDRARLRRCLAVPGPRALEQLGRVWPSPTTWALDAREADLDRRWRATLNLAAETVAALWESETTALLAYLGAKAEHAIERTVDAG
jgi:quercetin dioxygenase-like cupin family protein